MADNVTANAGSGGAVFATDDIGGVHHPYTKIEWGPADTANSVDAASGKGLPVQGEAAHDAATTGNPVLVGGRASAAAPTNVSADGDAVRAWHLLNGAQAVAITAAGALIGGDATNGLKVQTVGVTTHDAPVAGNPLLTGLEGRTSDGTPVTSGDLVRALADTLGKQVVLQGSTHDMQSNGTANFTTTTGADIIAAAGAGVRIAVTSILVTNAHATVNTKVTIRDGTTARIVGYAAAVGGGFTLSAGGRPLFITAANAAVTAICGTTGADVDVSISGYRIAN